MQACLRGQQEEKIDHRELVEGSYTTIQSGRKSGAEGINWFINLFSAHKEGSSILLQLRPSASKMGKPDLGFSQIFQWLKAHDYKLCILQLFSCL